MPPKTINELTAVSTLAAADEIEVQKAGETSSKRAPVSLLGWIRSTTNVVLATISDRVGIGTATPLTNAHVAAGTKVPSGELGGLLVTGATTSERLAFGYETAAGGWIQSVLNGVNATTLRLNPNGGNVDLGVTAGRFDTTAVADNTRLLLYDVTAGTLVRVSRGAVDSGGAGFRVLRIPN